MLTIIMLATINNQVLAAENNYQQFLKTDKNILIKNIKKKPEIIVFIRKGCGNCKKEEKFLTENKEIEQNFHLQLLDITKSNNKEKWQKLVTKHKLSKVTPITLINGDILVGFNKNILSKKIREDKGSREKYDLDFYLNKGTTEKKEDGYSCNVNSVSSCTLEQNSAEDGKGKKEMSAKQSGSTKMALPFFGEIDTKKASLFAMSSVLGFIDGFNPCAMWVLLTFLIILSQIGDRKKMIYLAGLFIAAEGIMYFLILNVWYQTWDFIQLDQWVTPLVGLIALVSGGYFLFKYHKNKNKELVCEVTSLEHQQKTVTKIKKVVSKPISILTILAVLGIAFSVNIIEFACSVGIAQSFTKILELNNLSFILRQWYIFIYSLFYMADDFLVFGLAIFGYQKFASVGTKYSRLSGLIGGILMIILGLLLILKPEWLG